MHQCDGHADTHTHTDERHAILRYACGSRGKNEVMQLTMVCSLIE